MRNVDWKDRQQIDERKEIKKLALEDILSDTSKSLANPLLLLNLELQICLQDSAPRSL